MVLDRTVPKPNCEATRQYNFYSASIEVCKSYWRHVEFCLSLQQVDALGYHHGCPSKVVGPWQINGDIKGKEFEALNYFHFCTIDVDGGM